MPAPATSEAFLDCVQKSGLVDPEHLQGHLQVLREASGLPAGPREMAQRLIEDGFLTAFQTTHLLRGKYKGFVVGKFKVLEPLGMGGGGRVYLCEHLAMGHPVAMKLLTGIDEADIAAVERFFREAQLAASLNHPNIVRAHDIDHDGKYYYLIMDYVDGISLHDLVREHGALDPVRAAHYIAQAAEGLQYMHENGLIHRDLKPANLLLDRSGTIKILDLGLARFLGDQGESLTKKYESQLILGTADYLSPEQAVHCHTVDIRSDIYSLGSTFYYILARRVPFPGKSAALKIVGHQYHQPDSLIGLRPEIPEALAAVVNRMMAKKPEDRYQEPINVVQALQDWITQPIDPPSASEFPHLRGPIPIKGPHPTPASGPPPSRLPRPGQASGFTPRPKSLSSMCVRKVTTPPGTAHLRSRHNIRLPPISPSSLPPQPPAQPELTPPVCNPVPFHPARLWWVAGLAGMALGIAVAALLR
jgi:serine/threonine protein kinase